MIHDFPDELLAEHNLVFEFTRQCVLPGVSCIPDPRLCHEIESASMNHRGALALDICAEENRRAEDALKRTHEPPILRTSLLHAECVQHLCGAAESNHSTLLLDGKCREKNRHEPILPPRNPYAG